MFYTRESKDSFEFLTRFLLIHVFKFFFSPFLWSRFGIVRKRIRILMGIIQVFRGIKGILYSTAIHVSREFREIYKTKKKAKKKKTPEYLWYLGGF